MDSNIALWLIRFLWLLILHNLEMTMKTENWHGLEFGISVFGVFFYPVHVICFMFIALVHWLSAIFMPSCYE